MKVLRDPQIISGFLYQEPVREIPALTHCGEALCCRGHSRPSHAHAGFEFLFLSRGTCHWQAAESVFRQKMGDLFIVYPGEPHQTGPKPNPENRHLWLGLHLEKLGPAGIHLTKEIRRQKIHLLPDCQEVEPLLQAIIRQVMTLRPRRAAVITSLLQAFIDLVAQRIATLATGDPEKSDRPIIPYSFAIQKAIAHMGQHLDRLIPLQELTAVSKLHSGPHLCALFRREVGTTPGRYHAQLRLESAREALRQPSATITNIALHYGFSSSQHFSTLFRSLFGVTPGQWKNGVVLRPKKYSEV